MGGWSRSLENTTIGQRQPKDGAFQDLEANDNPINDNDVGNKGYNDARYAASLDITRANASIENNETDITRANASIDVLQSNITNANASIEDKIDKISSTDNEIVRFSGASGDAQGYTSNASTLSDTGVATFPSGTIFMGRNYYAFDC